MFNGQSIVEWLLVMAEYSFKQWSGLLMGIISGIENPVRELAKI